jgi:hypothetical protein
VFDVMTLTTVKKAMAVTNVLDVRAVRAVSVAVKMW